ncbi:MAG: sel1 repeat family protein [Deltaproteobacteria bacterium]|nr:sel1 repeat family protein [Deltaproteobacteria bacterium]
MPQKRYQDFTLEAAEKAYEKGQALYLKSVKPEDLVECARLFSFAAFLGHAEAQRCLGLLYAQGEGVARDPLAAARWLELAAQSGVPAAQEAVGLLYYAGEGVERDCRKAAKWWKAAGAAGLPEAMNNLGNLYEAGLGVKKSQKEAARWWLAGAIKGQVNAQHNIAVAYQKGLGVPQDFALALKWFKAAAEQGLPEAKLGLGQLGLLGLENAPPIKESLELMREAGAAGLCEANFNLGLIYETGEYAPSDLNQALRHYYLAALQASPVALMNMAILLALGWGEPKVKKEAFSFLKEGSLRGDPKFIFCRGVAVLAGDKANFKEEIWEEAQRHIHLALKFNDPWIKSWGAKIARDKEKRGKLKAEETLDLTKIAALAVFPLEPKE